MEMKTVSRSALLLAAIVLFVTTGCRSNSVTAVTSTTPATTIAASSMAPITTLPISTSPTSVSATPTGRVPIIFDFDTNSPLLLARQGTPFDQTSGALTLHFSSAYDPGGFSIQNKGTTFFTLSQFSGNYLVASSSLRNILTIKFSHPLSSISLIFATIELHDPGPGGTPSDIKVTAYTDSAANAPMGTATAHGAVSSDSYPEGTLSFQTAQSFNLVTVEIPYLAQGAVDFIVDNITVVFA